MEIRMCDTTVTPLRHGKKTAKKSTQLSQIFYIKPNHQKMAHALENLFASVPINPPSPSLDRQPPALPGCALLAAKEGEEKAMATTADQIVVGHEVAPGFIILAVQSPDGSDGSRGRISFAPFLSERLKREQESHFGWDRSFSSER